MPTLGQCMIAKIIAKGATIQSPRGGGGWSFCCRKFQILLHVYTTLYDVNYLFHEISEIIYFKTTPAPPPWRLNGGPLIHVYSIQDRYFTITLYSL